MERQEILRTRLSALGFDVVRFVGLDQKAGRAERGLTDWLAAGFQADMDWMDRTAEKRLRPELVLEGARSAVLLGINYWPGDVPMAGPRWARYALYQDYHDTLKSALIEAGRAIEELYGVGLGDYRFYVDSGPVLERGWAERGGVGFVGKNAMLISRQFGNWLFLSEILTRLDFRSDPPLGAPTHDVQADASIRVGLNCGHCTRCIESCPTSAIRTPGVVDSNLCISYHTIENKGIVPRALRAAIGSRIYGCDICLDVCPWNRFAQESRRLILSARFDLAELTLAHLLALTPETFAEVFKNTPIKRTKLSGMLRNACIVAANTEARECLSLIVALCLHASAVVRAHAVWAVFRLAGENADALLTYARAKENDAAVLAEYAAR